MVSDERGDTFTDDWIAVAETRAAGWIAQRPDVDDALENDAPTREFILETLDAVLRPHSMTAAAAGLHASAPSVSARLPWRTRAAVRVSGALAPLLPAAVIPSSRRALRSLVDFVVVDARPGKIDTAIQTVRDAGYRVVVEPVASRPLGNDQAAARRSELARLLTLPGVDAVRTRVGSLVGLRSAWDFDDVVDEIVAALATMRNDGGARLILDVVTIDDFELTAAVMLEVLADPAWNAVPLGISLPLGLPATMTAVPDVVTAARARRSAGGATFELGLDTRVDASGDRARAALHGWDAAVHEGAVDVAATLLRTMAFVSDGDGDTDNADADAVTITLADNDPRRIAAAQEYLNNHDSGDLLTLEIAWSDRANLAPVLADVDVPVAVRVPVAHPGTDDVALAVAVRRQLAPETPPSAPDTLALAAVQAREPQQLPLRSPDRGAGATPRPDTRIVREKSTGDDGLTQEVIGIARAAIVTETSPIALEAADLLFGGTPFVETAVFQDREAGASVRGVAGFRAAPDTEPATGTSREWTRAILAAIPASDRGAVPEPDEESLAERIDRIREAASGWASLPAVERAAVLRRFARELESARAVLIETAAASFGALPADTDDDITAAIDAANFSASAAGELDAVSGAYFVPVLVTAVVTDTVDALTDLVDGMASALAAGSGAVLAPTSAAEPLAHALVAAVHSADLPDGLVTIATAGDDVQGEPGIDQLIATGSRTDALALRQRHPGLRISARADGRNVAIVAASADLDRAAADIVHAAFSRGGRGAAATNLVVVLGSAGRSRHFATLLADVARTWRAGFPEDPRSMIGPVELDEQQTWAMTELADGESWLVKPELSADGLWSGGVRTGVQPDGRFHLARANAPVIGVLAADMFAEAVRWQNASAGVVASLYTRSPKDLAYWLHAVDAGTLVVNGAARGPRAQRRPMPAWNSTSIGAAATAGGPHRLVGLGSWRASRGGHGSSTLHLRGLDSRITALIEAVQPELDFAGFDAVRRGALSDAVAWDRDFGRVKDVTGLRIERNLVRYRRVAVAIRADDDAPLSDVLRVLIAAVRARSEVTLSRAVGMPAGIRHALSEQGIAVFLEDDDEFIARVQASSVPRVRLIGEDTAALAERLAVVTDVTIFDDDVTTAGRLELLPFLREQAITIAAHRDGVPDRWSDAVI